MITRLFVVASVLLGVLGAPSTAQQSATSIAAGQTPTRLLGAPCTAEATEPVTEQKTQRTFLLDYPCDLKPGEKVTFVLSLHGGGSSGTWQRRYFPAYDYKERHRLVIASPYSPTRRWSEDDDAYLQNIVTSIVDAVGSNNVQAFWLAGHSQGGMTSRRLVCTDFFRRRVDGFLSLSGGRLGGAPQRAQNAGRPAQTGEPAAAAASPAAATQPAEPTCDFSHIFAIGEHEIASLPSASAWGQKYSCGARVRRDDVADTTPGYVHDGGRQNPGSKQWGLLPRPGRAEVFSYPGCRDGRVVADVVRIDKGHTEGLEPRVTEELVTLMLSARGGKIQQAR
jgi:pimeloyl-ACP methyl ester carboxylesterase